MRPRQAADVSRLDALGILLKLHGAFSPWYDDAAIGSSVLHQNAAANISPAMLC